MRSKNCFSNRETILSTQKELVYHGSLTNVRIKVALCISHTLKNKLKTFKISKYSVITRKGYSLTIKK